MLTEKEISLELNKEIKAPIRIGTLEDLGIDQKEFVSFFQPFFEVLFDDLYLIREKQLKYLKEKFPEDIFEINEIAKSYFEGDIHLKDLVKWTNNLSKTEKIIFNDLSFVTRQRNISSFEVHFEKDDEIFVNRLETQTFEQEVEDHRSWKRVFAEAKTEEVENPLFYSLLTAISKVVKDLHPDIKELKLISHFMRTICNQDNIGENSPEGIHEDGVDYIVSALVINRENCKGGQSQVYDEDESGNKNILLARELEIGSFVFQADTGEEKLFGNDLWHYVTPIEPVNVYKKGIRDIIGLDIKIIK